MVPFQITFLDFPESDAVWMAAQKRIEKLERFFSRIIRCEVVISCPHRHRHAARLFNVQIHIVVPGEDVIVTRDTARNEAHRDVYIAIRDAFNAAERILEDRARKIRREVKFHEDQYDDGRISKIFYHDGYGFLNSKDGREFYFGENCITNEKFDRLKIGQKVKFLEEPGEKGPQVTAMAVI
jgi:ribosomal subunit interface protein